ncbi:hypothetical protein SOV92_21555 [Pectobacterium brasiliense]|uniref:Uncharacterized protein n=1 Tax=Pectobacterium brasiliense TaxID=180957 RepID=A0AAW9HEW6_9GAMM|nr:hypothetical protein [Pectobacterium brasiliense]MDY4380357.1 hypothetical protein [Pectobacterium brasiliense]
MLDGYHVNGSGTDKKQRIIAVQAALEIIKAAISTPGGAKNVDNELDLVVKHLPKIADAIQEAVKK